MIRVADEIDAVWAEWTSLPDDEPSPVTRIARNLGMDTEIVAWIVYPPETYGHWADAQEPVLP